MRLLAEAAHRHGALLRLPLADRQDERHLGERVLAHLVADLVTAEIELVPNARLGERRLTLEVTDAAREWLALTGFDPAYGARPLRRLVQREIGDRLARGLLAGEISDGDTVLVDREAGTLEEPGEGLTVRAK